MIRYTLRSLALATALITTSTTAFAANPVVVMTTNMGEVEIELNQEKAPLSVKNFLKYVDGKTYDGTVFHRVIKGFMNQGGGFAEDNSKRQSHAPIKNEADNGLKNKRGTIAMARTSDPHSATNQFFINTVDNAFLDHKTKSLRGWGYAVFGKVTKGMEVMDKIAAVQTRNGPLGQNMPVKAVVIETVREK